MTTSEQNILQALTELEQAVKSIPMANPKPNLLPLFARIDELMRLLPAETDAALLHYLQRKSYEKARFWLEGRD